VLGTVRSLRRHRNRGSHRTRILTLGIIGGVPGPRRSAEQLGRRGLIAQEANVRHEERNERQRPKRDGEQENRDE
jgi:hypothetical protein